MLSWFKSLFSWLWSSDENVDPIAELDKSLGKVEEKLDQVQSVKDRTKRIEQKAKDTF